MMSRSTFGSYSRARDGCIVTFRLPDDTIEVKHFATVISDSRVTGITKGMPHSQQAIEWADEHDATIICMSTPETILRDLQGTRAVLERHRTGRPGRRDGMQLHPADSVSFPEKHMLKSRKDLFEQPGSRR